MSPVLIEPLGLLAGMDAAMAVEAGIARWLCGGPAAFTLVRRNGGIVPVAAVPERELASFTRAPPPWGGVGSGPIVMGILNATPDSFSDGGDHLDVGAAINSGERMLADGAGILDVGGESTRPGAGLVPEDVEQARILPIIVALARQGAVVSVDTRNAGTMARALDAGASIVNDVSGLSFDPAALGLVAERRCPVVLMHMRGTPATMAGHAVYSDVVAEVAAELSGRIEAAVAGGVARDAIMIDPGLGFAKTSEHNLTLLRGMPALLALGCRILVGVSRKSVIGMLSGQVEAKRRGPGSVAGALYALDRGANVVRVHDVAETVQAVRVWRGLAG